MADHLILYGTLLFSSPFPIQIDRRISNYNQHKGTRPVILRFRNLIHPGNDLQEGIMNTVLCPRRISQDLQRHMIHRLIISLIDPLKFVFILLRLQHRHIRKHCIFPLK